MRHPVDPELAEELLDLEVRYGLRALEQAMECLVDARNERSCSDDRPMRADNE